MLDLKNVTLLGIDCVDVDRLIRAITICEKYAKFGQVKLLTSQTTDYKNAVSIPHIGSIQEYSKFMIRELVNYVDTEYVLCVQWDAYILNPDAWTDDYLQYDYIGAPWWFSDDRNVGNGGFSLRSAKFLREVSKMPARNYHPEDVVCCRLMNKYLTNKGIKFAPEELAHRFSHEGNAKYDRTWRKQFGFHDFEMTDISAWNPPSEFRVIYRLCDQRYDTHLDGVNKVQCMNNFVKVFGKTNLTIIADNCRTPEEIKKMDCEVIVTNLGNAGTLKKAFELAMAYDDDDIVYLVEDDHLHLPGAKELILEGLEKADYVSLYDHPDKYIDNGPNPFIHDGGEQTRVFITKSSHWKYTNSTVQTFACRVSTLKEDKDILWKYNFEGPVPDSFKTFTELRSKCRKIATCIPGRATHCHSPWETPFVNWESVANDRCEEI